MKNKKGFTLIELLAVIIILGILMIIAIPSVTKYISDSRKSSYVDTAKEIIAGARNVVNEGKLGMYDTNTTYYIPSSYIKTENASKSPYGDFVQAYIVVIYNGQGYKYYWISVDDAGQGVKEIVSYDKLDLDDIESDIDSSEIESYVKTTVVGNRNTVKILDTERVEWITPVEPIANHVPEDGTVCRPAKELHTKVCDRSGTYGCGGTVGNGNTITYGTLISGSPKAGDAYDCDVNNDGTYDSETERFYYITSDGSHSVLIYYINMNDQTTYAYDASDENWHGPRTAYQYLPNLTEWDNPGLIAPGTRQIVAENGNSSTSGSTIESFTYTGKAARFLTAQELNNACEITIGSETTGELDNCSWLMENVGFYENHNETKSYGYWLETPRYDSNYSAWRVNGYTRISDSNHTFHTPYYGVRPVITVNNTNLG